MDINTSLLRERFVLQDQDKYDPAPKLQVVSNRIDINLSGREISEHFVVRAQTMHICVRMASRIIQSFQKLGALMNRTEDHDWEKDWKAAFSDYERFHNPDIWCSVFFEGQVIFSHKEHHVFLDLIEKCAYEHDGSYDDAIPLAQKALTQTGQDLDIHHENNVALNIELQPKAGKCGIIHRGPTQTTTFSIHASPQNDARTVNFAQLVNTGAAFLEGIQLCFLLGMNEVKIEYGIIERFSQAEKHTKDARERLKHLVYEIQNLENSHTVRYRPEKPDFDRLIAEAEALGRETLEPPEQPSILSEGERQALLDAQDKALKRLEDDTEQSIDAVLRDDNGKMFQ